MSRPNLEEIYGRLETLKRAGSTLYRDDLEALLPYIADLEEERKELQERVKELEVYEEREMSITATIVDKLRNYEYEKNDCGDAVGDIYALIHHIAALEEEIDDLKIKAREMEAWEGRYRALLEECEASRPPEIAGGDASRGASRGVIAIDGDGYSWIAGDGHWWELSKDPDSGAPELPEKYGPYTLAYIPKGES